MRERCLPRKEGIAQKPQFRSHPSAIFTYDHGLADAGLGRFNRSNEGGTVPAPSTVPPAALRLPSTTGVLPAGHADTGGTTICSGLAVSGMPNGATRSTSGMAWASSSPYRSAIQPVTTSRAPAPRASASESTVSIDSWRAASMNAQVLTTTRSASSGESAASRPSTVRIPTSLSESTWFFGHPNVSIQYRSATRTIYRRDRRARRTGGSSARWRSGLVVVAGMRTPGPGPAPSHAGPGPERAEREGFEPSDPVTQVNSLAVSPIRPLSHLSLPPQPIFGPNFP